MVYDFSTAREPKAPFAPLGREPEEGESFAIDDMGMKLVKMGGILHPSFMKKDEVAKVSSGLTLREDEIVVATYPKCGTTWMQQVVLLMLAGGDKSQIGDVFAQAPWIEMTASIEGTEAVLQAKPTVGDRRVWKTHALNAHLPWAPESRRAKKIIVTRNPFDAAVSMYHHVMDSPAAFQYSGEWDHFVNLYMTGSSLCGDFWEWHKGWHAYSQEHPSDTIWVTFEDMKEDLPRVVKQLSTFLSIPLSEEEVQKVAENAGFTVMKKQFEEQDAIKEAAGKKVKKDHIRKGEVGAWVNTFTEEQTKAFREVHEKMMVKCELPPSLFRMSL
eukprot:TRINITY_DN2312_c0_g1_i4.p1 TRINITY_DN2312_c0_g1~~TRINITY_DN2312_c0_g1_i4.p1  ORF type:complete len:328 (+),score=108.06 TRINITY_DN2312_c0_g1_i4:103-1086(+)